MYPEILAGRFNFSAANQHYVLSDFPVPLVYKKLDLAYPNSKFILTTRSTDAFLKSAEKHWELGTQEASRDWRTMELHWTKLSKANHTNEIHEMAYGQKHFDRDLFAKRFEAHNKDVQDYFADRPDDLLVIDLEKKPDWNLLCEFLQKAGFSDLEIPQTPYPHKFKTVDRLQQIADSQPTPEAQ